jgi:hypothetical protein
VVFPTRGEPAAGAGESGFPRWQEAARYHVKALGADASVWNESGCPSEQGIRCRPRYANAISADVLVSLHNNGGGGTGTETLYGEQHGRRRKQTAGRHRAHRDHHGGRDFNAAWPDRRVKGFNGTGENRLAATSILIELAFMDRQSPDNDALQIEVFRRSPAPSARVREFFDGRRRPPRPPACRPRQMQMASTGMDDRREQAGFRLGRRPAGTDVWARWPRWALACQHRDTTAAGTD